MRAARGAVLLVPAFLLLIGALRSSGGSSILLGLGSLFQFLACGLSFCSRKGWREPVGPAVIMLYVIGLSWHAGGRRRPGRLVSCTPVRRCC